MIYEIWKLAPSNPNKFMGYDMIKIPIDITDYIMVYSGKTKDRLCNNRILEMLFEKFNINHPDDYYSESMSVSDIICAINEETNERVWWYVDTIGFRKVKV